MFVEELARLNVGYTPNRSVLNQMNDLVSTIDYIEHCKPTSDELIKIIQYYDEA